jgi:hypothetical protein
LLLVIGSLANVWLFSLSMVNVIADGGPMEWFKLGKKKADAATAAAPASSQAEVAIDNQFVYKLRPYLTPPALLDPGITEGAPEVLPGIVFVVAVDMGTQVNFLPVSSMISLLPADTPDRHLKGPTMLRRAAVENLSKLPLPPVQITQIVSGRADSEVLLLEQQDSFVASRATFLNHLLDQVCPGKPRNYGVLLAIPRRRTLLLHVPCGIGVLKAIESMALTAKHLFDSSTQSRLSPHVYYVAASGEQEIAAGPRKENEVCINTVGIFGSMLYGPNGLLHPG